ncbi:uncharacterized protein LOC133806403 [Humulus lupulus]|uniref:uncharacterized protein LOC133806403 n=1 Tax=Humulus lupulus TaxID=3486 RepID=UPI002B40FA29|nr:uncharacterized protein LOC133806403 [Humulus lupulus]
MDVAAGGTIISKSVNVAHELLEDMATNNHQWSDEWSTGVRKVDGIHELDAITTLTAHVASFTKQPQCNFPSNTEANPKAQCNAISLRSGKKLEEPVEKSSLPLKMESAIKEKVEEKVTENLEKNQSQVSTDHHIKIPFPMRLRKNNLDKQFAKFLEVFKKLHINIPFAEALEKMPSYLKFLKEIL